jgi:spermidine synthase
MTRQRKADAPSDAATPRRRKPAVAPATISEEDGVRYLHLGTPWVQGAMRIGAPRAIELEYVRRMMTWMLLRPTDELEEGHAVQLGLGAAAITRFTHKVLHMRTTAVELNPSVVDACRLWFQMPADGRRLKVIVGDAGAWVAEPAHAASVQVLCIDLYDHEAAAPVLDDDAFYAHCHRVLAPGGVMSVNLFGRNASFERSAARIAAAFGHQPEAPCVWKVQPTSEGNTVVLASRSLPMPDRDTLAMRAECIEERYGLPARKWLRMIRPLPRNLPAAAIASSSQDPAA